MLNNISLKLGNEATRTTLVIPTDGITVFVGPNNSGKSLVLREVEAYLQGNDPSTLKLLDSVDLALPTDDEIDALIARANNPFKDPSIVLPDGTVQIGKMNPHGGYELSNLNVSHLKSLVRSGAQMQWVGQNFLKFFVLRLDGRTRFELTNDRQSNDLKDPPQSMHANLLVNAVARGQVQGLIQEAFGKHFAIDPSAMVNLRMRLHDRPPTTSDHDLGLTPEALSYHRSGQLIKEASDGVQAYTGIACAVSSSDYSIILIDEPEAFLHPPLARLLGAQLARIARERRASLLASTHSSDFLLGCLQSGLRVHVVRLQYRDRQSGAQFVDNATLLSLFRDPLLRSSNVVSALFHEGAVVTEADGDRVFYNEIYRRMLELQNDLPSTLVLQAHNKQTIRNIVRPLRKFGVPAAAVVDLDVLRDGGSEWTNWLNTVGIPSQLIDGYARQRHAIVDEFAKIGKDMKRDGGVAALQEPARSAALQLLENLAEYGMFVVPSGELESWLPTFGRRGQKNDWVIATLQAMGQDPTSENYARPDGTDIWKFMAVVLSWIANPNRKGMASD